MNAIELNQVTKSYGGFTLDHVSLALPMGTIMGLVGENGAGKSTAIKLMMGAIPPDSGSVSLLGVPGSSREFTAVKQDVGVVLDEAYVPEVLNARDLEKIMENTYVNWDREAWLGYIKAFRLPMEKKLRDYSRGMKMKLAIAAALSHHPRLLVLDEATSGLDPIVRDEILDVFNEFTRDEGHSILLSSHIISDLEKICDYIAFLHKGKLMLCEEKDVLLERYAVVKLSREDFAALPEHAVVRRKQTGYGCEALVLRDQINPAFTRELTTLEDIILFMAKEDT